ncbi:hypothetical protein MJO28_014857 [Puccinia striiformis f. sp. tritici]|uniref:Uncharacterized protein n=2 Tax=Puccinia striiformis TaxID=27350 RepID=A0A2S4UN12_9BASI|nr:hypothetical protein Pst134EA_027737 [Puccinia striiformis f. sp. tritici]KAH9448426.1 hypothetical protein Pst134EA_027737 [Puccinia striiformis f. sp. tritici]KAI7937937.1 hypothetical protein MJO28_014857 [Puccinia striiformis f. sp. tritici]POV98659.1 hypothetical protein PSHT_13940 [Puccinia striiformis]
MDLHTDWHDLLAQLSQPTDPGAALRAELAERIDDFEERSWERLAKFEESEANLAVSPQYNLAFEELRSELLPGLKVYIDEIFDQIFVEPSNLPEEGDNQIENGIDFVQNVDANIEALTIELSKFWVSPPQKSSGPSCFTPFRCASLQLKVVEIIKMVHALFQLRQLVIALNGNPTVFEELTKNTPEFDKGWTKIAKDKGHLQDAIDDLIKWFDLSDAGVMHDRLQSMAHSATVSLHHPLAILICQKPTYVQSLHESISVIKLSRVYFNKICRDKRHPFHLLPSSDQIAFIQTIQPFTHTLKLFADDVAFTVPAGHSLEVELGDPLVNLVTKSNSIINKYYNSLNKNPESSSAREDLESIQQYRSWYKCWFNEFDLAIDQFYDTYQKVFPGHFADPDRLL